MISKFTDPDRLKLIIALCGLLAACAPAPRFYLQYGKEFKQDDLGKLLDANSLRPGENIKVVTLGQGAAASHHLVQVRDREVPHLHKFHDGTVTILRGEGFLMLEQRRVDLKVGDVVYIPRGAVHYFVNTDREPAVAFVVYAPPFDGQDVVPMKMP